MELLQIAPPKSLPLLFRRVPQGAPIDRAQHQWWHRPVPASSAAATCRRSCSRSLDSIQIGAMAVGANLQVAFANRTAVRECSRHGLLRIEDARVAVLDVPGDDDHVRLARAIEGAHTGHWSLVRLGSGATMVSIAVSPLFVTERGTGPLALLLFGLCQNKEPLTIQLYARSCGLTPAETRVLLGLAEGLVPKQIASKHEVLLSTVRARRSAASATRPAHAGWATDASARQPAADHAAYVRAMRCRMNFAKASGRTHGVAATVRQPLGKRIRPGGNASGQPRNKTTPPTCRQTNWRARARCFSRRRRVAPAIGQNKRAWSTAPNTIVVSSVICAVTSDDGGELALAVSSRRSLPVSLTLLFIA